MENSEQNVFSYSNNSIQDNQIINKRDFELNILQINLQHSLKATSHLVSSILNNYYYYSNPRTVLHYKSNRRFSSYCYPLLPLS